ncbi:GxxExxY protein [Psychrilyobacter sp.]|uniref:GxxExxY protein n=1 Tax=Psychrilyobacter sp. TaxID=2586924 RepID=UPI003016FCB1
MKEFLYKDLSYKIIDLSMEVHRELGNGFLEKVYENGLMVLFEKNNIKAVQQQAIKIEYQEKNIGDYIADIIVEDKIILELKCVSKIMGIHKAQLANYLKATGKEVGILLNFRNKSLEIERVVLQKSVESEKSATKKENIEMSSEEVREAKTELIRLSNDDKEREFYNLREKANKDRASALEKALNDGLGKGIEQGKQKEKLDIAKNLLDILDNKTIAIKTGLKEEDVEKLRS